MKITHIEITKLAPPPGDMSEAVVTWTSGHLWWRRETKEHFVCWTASCINGAQWVSREQHASGELLSRLNSAAERAALRKEVSLCRVARGLQPLP